MPQPILSTLPFPEGLLPSVGTGFADGIFCNRQKAFTASEARSIVKTLERLQPTALEAIASVANSKATPLAQDDFFSTLVKLSNV